MDCLIEIGASIVGTIAEYTVAPVGRQLGYIFFYRSNIDNLKTETEDLKLKKKMMENLVDEAKRKGDEIYDHINVWLSEVDNKITELGEEDTTEMKCTFKGSFTYLASRYKLGKKAKEMGESVVKLKGRINSHDHISFRPKLQCNFENKYYLRSVTREKFVDEIMEVLGDANVRTIGLHGMPGVGKTTLVKEIARKAIEEDPRLFNDAVIVTVSQTPDLNKIQQQIGERLGLNFRKETLYERALELRRRLKDENKFLIVLDDVWNELKLEDIGIVFESDQKGCKILITSRFERVLGTYMKVGKNLKKVELLSEDEARNWFNDIVGGDVAKTREFKEIGNKIVKRCGCLPLAIVTVANSLKNCGLPIWRDACTRLENSEQNEIVSSAIRLCYDILESDEIKKLVSLCSLYEEDANIQMDYILMRNCWGMGMFKGNMTLQKARDRVYGWVNTLKDRCLLLDGDYSGTVKMHDVVRDITISIAKERHNMHCFRDGDEVEEFLNQKKIEDLRAISLPNGYLDELDFERSEYTQLQLMICTWGKSSKIIPGSFLDRTKQLKVLDFSNQDYPTQKVLGSDLSPLQNLRTLRLRESAVEAIAEIGKLKNLEILDLSESYVNKLPGEIGQLTRLRMLDLSGCKYLHVIEPNVILHFKHLEELYVENFTNWHEVDQVDNEERRNAGLDELKHLVHLAALHLYVPDIGMLPEVLLRQKLERYHIQIGGDKYYLSKNSDSRHLLIEHTESSLLREHGLDILMKRSEELWLKGLNGVNNIVSELDTEDFPELKSLRLESNNTIQYLVNYSMGKIHPCIVFGSLETLNLYNLSNLKQICHGEVTVESFKTLRVVTVRKCNSLKKLLPLFNVRQLEEIEIVDCEEMEEIFTHEIQEDDDDNKEELLQLRSLKLEGVSKLKEFCSKRLLKKIGSTSEKEEEPFVGDSVMPLFNGKFLCFPKLELLELSGCHVKKLWDDQLVPSSTSFCCLTELVVDNCKHLKCVVPSSTAANFKQLYSLEVRGCEAMEEIVSRDERMEKMSFPKLYSMELEDLPRLSKFSSGIFIEFPMLNDLHIGNFPELKTFVSESSEDKSNTTMPSLFNENFVCFPTLEKLELSGCNVKKLWDDQLVPSSTSFYCLTELVVHNCKHLKCVVPSSTAANFKQLYYLVVKRCEAMEEIVSRDERMEKMSFPKLYSMGLGKLPRLSKFSSGIFIEFPMLNDLHIGNCPELKTFVSESSEDKSNTTMPSLFNENFVCFPKLEKLVLLRCGFKKIWDDQLLPNSASFRCLSTLEVAHCKFLKYVFSSAMAVRFEQFISVDVRDCETMEEIMSRSDERMDNIISFPKLETMDLYNNPNMVSFSKTSEGSSLFDERVIRRATQQLQVAFPNLESLSISQLDGLKMIWQYGFCNNIADSFCKLEKVQVLYCKNLMGIFPSGMHTRLGNLKQLVIIDCEMVEEIFQMETSNSEEIHDSISTRLYSMELSGLSNLKYVWNKDPQGTFTYPNLDRVFAHGCPNLKAIFPPSVAKHLSRLRILRIRNCGIEEVIGKKQEGLETVLPPDHDDEFVFPRLQIMELTSLPNLVSFYAGTHTVRLRFPLLEELEVADCLKVKAFSGSELLSFQGRHESLQSTKVTFGRDLKCEVKLCELPKLMHWMMEEEEESSQQQPQILRKLKVVRCKGLKKLGPSSISFRNLDSLIVTDCHGMLHLLSSQTAKSMTQLSELRIQNCERMEEIISDAEVDSKGGEIVFTRLEYLELDELPRLASFYSGNYTMRSFPNLKLLGVNECFHMQSFSKHGYIISTPKLKKIIIDHIDYGESEPELESEPESESEIVLSSNRMVDINSIIAKHWMSHGATLQELH